MENIYLSIIFWLIACISTFMAGYSLGRWKELNRKK